jgi:hypothetical protein
MNSYEVGTTVGLPGMFTNPGITPYDPATLICRVEQPSGEVIDVSSSIVRISVGNYQAQFNTVQIGEHIYEWIVSTGFVAGVFRARFYARDKSF